MLKRQADILQILKNMSEELGADFQEELTLEDVISVIGTLDLVKYTLLGCITDV